MRGVPTLKDLGDIRGARVLVRLGLNVPIHNGEVAEPFRLETLLPTLRRLREIGARTLVVGHMGTVKGEGTLRPVHAYLRNRLGELRFVERLPFDTAVLNEGDIALLENIRQYPEEATNDTGLAEKLASCADVYINDAFSDSHREHASVTGVARLLPSYIGPWFETEIRELSRAFEPSHPFEFIVGGAKIATKLPLVRKFLDIADNVYVCGALANDIWESKGYEVGRSLVSPSVELNDVLTHERLSLPTSVLVERGGESQEVGVDEVGPTDRIVDVGEHSLVPLKKHIEDARFIVWNGPLGDTETGYVSGTHEVARMIADTPVHAIVGGGDTIAAISKLNIFDRFGFVSTGGGAMLSFLSDETLVGIEAIREYWGKGGA